MPRKRRGGFRRGSGRVRPTDILVGGAGVAAGFLGSQWALDTLGKNVPQIGSGWGRVAAKAGVAVGAAMLGRKLKIGGRNFGQAVSLGAAGSAALDGFALATQKAKGGGVSGLAGLGADDFDLQLIRESRALAGY